MHSTPDAADEILVSPETEEPLSPTYSTLPKLLSLYQQTFCMGRLKFLRASATGLRTFNCRLRLSAEDFCSPGSVQVGGALAFSN